MTTADVTPSPPPLHDLVLGDGTPRKALLTALVVGTILTAINRGDSIVMHGDRPPLLKIVLTYCVPYCVTTWGAVTGKRAQWRRALRGHSQEAGATRSARRRGSP